MRSTVAAAVSVRAVAAAGRHKLVNKLDAQRSTDRSTKRGIDEESK